MFLQIERALILSCGIRADAWLCSETGASEVMRGAVSIETLPVRVFSTEIYLPARAFRWKLESQEEHTQ